jgi:hypothetical protein
VLGGVRGSGLQAPGADVAGAGPHSSPRQVRELAGCYGYDTTAELEKLNENWELMFCTDYLLLQQKLIPEERQGVKMVKKHDAKLKRLKPAALARQIRALTGPLEADATRQSSTTGLQVNTWFQLAPNRIFPDKATTHRSRTN